MNEAAKTVPRTHNEIKLTTAEVERFWAKVNKDGPTMPRMETPCWAWIPSKIPADYGRLKVSGKLHKSHRVSWTLHNGAIPKDRGHHGICVCHHCDNPSCVNPAHLFLGTHIDNVRDRELKGRRTPPSGNRHWTRSKPESLARGDSHRSRTKPETLSRGDSHGMSKLTSSKVVEIRAIYDIGGISAISIGKRFGLAKSTIQSVLKRKTWKHVL
jgi:hypothetical protein